MRNYLLLINCLVFYSGIWATGIETPIELKTLTGTINGSLLVPSGAGRIPIVLIIAGSGPTDRNGNNSAMENNSLKMLAKELAGQGIASLRYDKRGVGESEDAISSERNLRFNTYVEDAIDWIKLLKTDKRFSKVIVIGHSEGSTIGMIAARKAGAAKFISIEGPGRTADKVLREQFSDFSKEAAVAINGIIDSLVAGKPVRDVPIIFYAFFRPDIQPYIMSWFQYNPPQEIKKLTIPTLIVQGTNDLQVGMADAKILAQAYPKAKLVTIQHMNHVLKETTDDRKKNKETYNDPDLPIMNELIKQLASFILTP